MEKLLQIAGEKMQISFDVEAKDFKISLKNFLKNTILFYVAINELKLDLNAPLMRKCPHKLVWL